MLLLEELTINASRRLWLKLDCCYVKKGHFRKH